MLYLPVRNEWSSDSIFLPVENAGAFLGRYAFLRLAPIVNTITTRSVITTNGIMPNSGIGSEGIVVRG